MIFKLLFVIGTLLVIYCIVKIIKEQKEQGNKVKGLLFYLILICTILIIYIYIFTFNPSFDKYRLFPPIISSIIKISL